MALDGQPAEPFFLARARDAGTPAPGTRGRCVHRCDGAPGSTTSILLHDGREARPIARLIASNEPPLRNGSAAGRPLRCHPMACSPARPQKNALRIDLTLGDHKPIGSRPPTSRRLLRPRSAPRPPQVVLALTNPPISLKSSTSMDIISGCWTGSTTAGSHFWLDTLAIEPGQTQRVRVRRPNMRRWLMEAMATDWEAPPSCAGTASNRFRVV